MIGIDNTWYFLETGVWMRVSRDGFVAENFRQQNLNQSTPVRVFVKMGMFFNEKITQLKKEICTCGGGKRCG